VVCGGDLLPVGRSVSPSVWHDSDDVVDDSGIVCESWYYIIVVWIL